MDRPQTPLLYIELLEYEKIGLNVIDTDYKRTSDLQALLVIRLYCSILYRLVKKLDYRVHESLLLFCHDGYGLK